MSLVTSEDKGTCHSCHLYQPRVFGPYQELAGRYTSQFCQLKKNVESCGRRTQGMCIFCNSCVVIMGPTLLLDEVLIVIVRITQLLA